MLYKAIVLEAKIAIWAALQRLKHYPDDAYVAVKNRVGTDIFWHRFQVEDIRALGKIASCTKHGTKRSLQDVLSLQMDPALEVYDSGVLDRPDVGSMEGIVCEEDRFVGVLCADSPAYRGAIEQSSKAIKARASRYLNASVEQIFSDGRSPVDRRDDFARGGTHRVSISVVTRDSATGLVADAPLPLDPEMPHRLEISFMAAWLPPTEPQPLSLTDQNPEPVQVTFTLPRSVKKVALTITVHEIIKEKRKIVQTAVLTGEAVEPCQSGPGLKLRVDRRLQQPSESIPSDVCLVLAEDTLAVFDGIQFTPPIGIMEWRAQLGDQTLALWSEIDGIAQIHSVSDDILANPLQKLAGCGRELYDMLNRKIPGTTELKKRFLKGQGGIQIVSRDLDIDFPLEFVYDGPKPNLHAPELCESFFVGLNAGQCQNCPNRSNEICAFDFWGLRRRIERRVVDLENFTQKHSVDQPSHGSERTSYTSPALLAASKRVTSTSLAPVINALRAFDASINQPLANWNEWATELETDIQYRLLVLLAHKEDDPSNPTLEIGGMPLHRGWLDEAYVNPRGEAPGPLVLLTGCETARPDYGFLSFIARFLDSGAAAVVGTLAQIREDESAKATEHILFAIRDVLASDISDKDRSIGEVIRRARCRLLAQHDLTGLNLVAYGETGWQLRVDAKA